MAKVLFVPKGQELDISGWPMEMLGDGFIDLKFCESNSLDDSAIYRDNFREEYEFFGKADTQWWIEVSKE